MKSALASVLMLAVAASFGCMSPQGGGMGKDNGFKLGQPMSTVKMKQMETRAVKVSVHRGKFFKQDIKLEARPSEGLSVEPTEAVVKANEPGDVYFRITAPKDAAVGEYRVFIKGYPEDGEPTQTEIRVSVSAP